MIEINKNPSKKELAVFGLLCLLFFGIVGAIMWHKSHSPRAGIIVWCIATAFVAVYYAAPGVRKPIYLGWMYAAYPIGWTVSHLLMAIVFFGVITPIGFIMRLMGRDPLQRAFDPAAKTYWIAHPRAVDPQRYFRQF